MSNEDIIEYQTSGRKKLKREIKNGILTMGNKIEQLGLKVRLIAGKGNYHIPPFNNVPEDKIEVTGGYYLDENGEFIKLREKVQHSLNYVAKKIAEENDALVYLAQKRGNSFFGEKYNMYQIVLGRMKKGQGEDGSDKHEIIADIWLTISDGSVHGE
jgi:hypothetical protein